MTADFILANVLLFGPGFLFTKLIYLFGQQHKRLDWEWLVWSLITGLPIAYVSAAVVSRSLTPAIAASGSDGWEVLLRFGIAVVGGLGVAGTWRRIRHSKRWVVRLIRRSLTDSAWDLILDTATHDNCGVGVTVERVNKDGLKLEETFYGNLKAFGYEAAGVEPILMLNYVQRYNIETKKYEPWGNDGDAMVFHRDNVLRLWIYEPEAKVVTEPSAS